MYEYRAKVKKVYDGDTITVNIDLGFNIKWSDQVFRLAGIDAPELRGDERPEGLKSRDWLRKKILGKQVEIRTLKDKKGKYGRWIAYIYLPGEVVSVNYQMCDAGLAEEKDY